MLVRLFSILAAAAVLSLTTGCGDSVDKNAYVKDVSSVQRSTQTEAQQISTEIGRAKTQDAIADKLDALAETVKKNADRLAAIEAPADVADLHREYVDLMRKFSTDLEELADRIRKATPDSLQGILKDTGTLTSELATEEQRLVDKINQGLQS